MSAVLIILGAALVGAPLFAVIGAGALAGFSLAGIDLSVVAIEIFRLADSPVLVAIPLFALAGYLLAESRASQRLVALTEALLAWAPGGLALVALLACAFFTALTGASGVTIIALGALLYPALRQGGYPDRFALGLVTTSGSLGLLFPPSLGLILYGVIAQQMQLGQSVSVEAMFRAGLLPGALMLALLSAWAIWFAHCHGVRHRVRGPGTPRPSPRAAIRAAIWEIPLPFVIVGGVYGGVLALSEAAAVTLLYAFVVECLIHREVDLGRLPAIMREAMILVGAILVILAVSLAATTFLVDAQVPMRLFAFLRGYIDSPLAFLLALNVFLLLLGMILDLFAALVIMVPLLLPVALGYGIDPVHLGIIFLANLQIGFFTPPVGMNLFIAAQRFGRPVVEIWRSTLPFMGVLLCALALITYWPALTLALVR
ncbi:MAG TPA: TRAP transporter large permease subunit [Rhodocyclaceae bacterium]|nr:TRAP transporter large permease subunit [Rhodocyclaceae bacterium]